MTEQVEKKCGWRACTVMIDPDAGNGAIRQYCGDGCKKKASRARQKKSPYWNNQKQAFVDTLERRANHLRQRLRETESDTARSWDIEELSALKFALETIAELRRKQ